MRNVDQRPFEILLVDDSPSDAALAIEALHADGMANHVVHVENGVEALEYLRGEWPYAGAPRPDIILLDLNMPRKDGREVLTELKADSNFRTIPVIVLTTSQADRDIQQSYELHANCYIVKPVDFTKFTEVVSALQNFWLSIATLPKTAYGAKAS
jgi:CheY-like chemotaxis protein